MATIPEPRAGALRARTGELRALREASLARAGAMDAMIAATAPAHDLAVWTQDDDFAILASPAPDPRVRRDGG